MKLQEYFNQQKVHSLSDVQKMNVYYSVMDKNMKKSFQRKRSLLHVKTFVYTSFLLFFLVGFYGMYLFQQPTLEDGEAYLLSRLSNTNVAQADFVAKIVDFEGSFYIEQGGKTLQTSNIKDGDLVTLKKWAQIIFHIDNNTKAKILWPAKFVVNKTSTSSYKVALLYGEYVEMSSLQKENNHNIELSIDGLIVAQWETKKPIDFQVVKQGKNHVIKNNGAKLLVTSEDQKATSVGNKQVLAVQWNDISLFDSFDKFATAVKEKNLSQTFTFVDQLEKEEVVGKESKEQDLKELAGEEILSVNDEEIPNIDLWLSDGQSVATPEQTKIIETQLNKTLLQNNINEVISSYKWGDGVVFSNSFAQLEKKIITIAKAFQYDYSPAKGTEQERVVALAAGIQKVAEHIQQNYLLPPKYVESIKAIIPDVLQLKGLPFEKVSLEESNNVL